MLAVGLASLVLGDLAVIYAAVTVLADEDERPALVKPATTMPATGTAPAPAAAPLATGVGAP